MSDEADAQSTRLMLAYLCVANEADANLMKRVQVLDRFGLADEEIARVCAVTSQSVRNARLKGKKQTGGTKTKGTAQEK